MKTKTLFLMALALPWTLFADCNGNCGTPVSEQVSPVPSKILDVVASVNTNVKKDDNCLYREPKTGTCWMTRDDLSNFKGVNCKRPASDELINLPSSVTEAEMRILTADVCSIVEDGATGTIPELIHRSFSNLAKGTGYCYRLSDPAIYKKIRCGSNCIIINGEKKCKNGRHLLQQAAMSENSAGVLALLYNLEIDPYYPDEKGRTVVELVDIRYKMYLEKFNTETNPEYKRLLRDKLFEWENMKKHIQNVIKIREQIRENSGNKNA